MAMKIIRKAILNASEAKRARGAMEGSRSKFQGYLRKTALMSEDPTQQFGGTLRGYLDFLYREAEQQLMWEKLDAATNRLSTIQEAQDLERRPVVSLTSRNSISQMKSARTAAFETLEEYSGVAHGLRSCQRSFPCEKALADEFGWTRSSPKCCRD